MDTNQTLFSAGVSIATYILYKVAQRYYIRSGCHDKTIEITIVDKEEEKKEEIELTTNPRPSVAQIPEEKSEKQKNEI
jgi:aminoglycoside phosphotransferase (APT) family kinase protein